MRHAGKLHPRWANADLKMQMRVEGVAAAADLTYALSAVNLLARLPLRRR